MKSEGAVTEFINLCGLNYKGCSSCFACKHKNNRYIGKCSMVDNLTITLEKIINSDALIIGSPIYIGDITSLTRAF
ncbi:flavodoxin family protein [endosymbiont 'TC1' of Trimyema compressum]|uniref:flavodoxin family protein n=1 Tax=endosymbiont 'TC1' of Trimyema compressum TaxID=243899 RepID=UPI001FE158B0|nr:NAD(P)H-dependent oxidoreductase [endosymbiont 'TC1' of Trimyema compressum]